MPRAQDGVPLGSAGQGWGGPAGPRPPPAFLWIRVETRKHSLPSSPTASLPSVGPAGALPASCNSGSPAFRGGDPP